MSYGLPGAGVNVSIFADPSHTFMELAGHYFGTSAQNPGGGANWIPSFPGDIGGPRHPAGFARGGVVNIDPRRVRNGILPGLATGGIVQQAIAAGASAPKTGAGYSFLNHPSSAQYTILQDKSLTNHQKEVALAYLAHPTAGTSPGPAATPSAPGGLLRGYDATGGSLGSIPTSGKDAAQWVASYLDNYGGYSQAKSLFPHIPVVSISVTPGHNIPADIYDVEPKGKTVAETVAAIKAGRTKGAYGGASDLAAIHAGVGGKAFAEWIAAWPGTGSYTGASVGPYGAHQFASGAGFDTDVATAAFLQAVTGQTVAGAAKNKAPNLQPGPAPWKWTPSQAPWGSPFLIPESWQLDGKQIKQAGRFAAGGAVTASSPTMALFGEAGPETALFLPHAGLTTLTADVAKLDTTFKGLKWLANWQGLKWLDSGMGHIPQAGTRSPAVLRRIRSRYSARSSARCSGPRSSWAARDCLSAARCRSAFRPRRRSAMTFMSAAGSSARRCAERRGC